VSQLIRNAKGWTNILVAVSYVISLVVLAVVSIPTDASVLSSAAPLSARQRVAALVIARHSQDPAEVVRQLDESHPIAHGVMVGGRSDVRLPTHWT